MFVDSPKIENSIEDPIEKDNLWEVWILALIFVTTFGLFNQNAHKTELAEVPSIEFDPYDLHIEKGEASDQLETGN